MGSDSAMPRSLRVRNLDDDLVQRLKLRAVRHKRSIEAEHREILREVLSEPTDPDFERRLAEFRNRTAGRRHTPAETLQRISREDR